MLEVVSVVVTVIAILEEVIVVVTAIDVVLATVFEVPKYFLL